MAGSESGVQRVKNGSEVGQAYAAKAERGKTEGDQDGPGTPGTKAGTMREGDGCWVARAPRLTIRQVCF